MANNEPVVDLHAFDMVTTYVSQFSDEFDTQSFSNSHGLTPWTTSWVETNDGANAIGDGQIQTNAGGTEAMRFVAGDGASVTRAVSLNPSQPTTLSYVYSFSGFDTGDTLTVEFAANGTDFVTLQTIAGATANNAHLGPTTFSAVVSGTANSALRFTTSTLTDIEGIRIDDVSISSGSTAQVMADDGINFTTTFIEENPGVALASNSAIIDPDSPMFNSARIRLVNADLLDALSIAGTLPAGITSSFGPLEPGEITLILSGLASAADYQTAIEAVRFANTSLNPNGQPRIIEITVSDAEGPGPVAIATVNFVLVNDAPVAVADAIVTNVSTGNIVIPEWVLLANDSDPDSDVLDITGFSAAAGIVGLSLATNPGSVTFADDGGPTGSFAYIANDGNAVDGSTYAAVTVTNQGYTTLADNFQGLNATTPSAANRSTGTTSWAASSWTETDDDGNIRTGQIQIDAGAAPGTNNMLFGVGDGASISRVVNLTGVTAATLSLAFDKNNIDVGESVEVQFAADGVTFVTLATITNTNGTIANGNANGGLNGLALTGALGAASTIRFVGSAINTVGEDIRIDDVVVAYAAPNANVVAGGGNQILVGNDAGSTFTGGAGNDTVLANGGDDTINWSVGHGRDFVDGGANGAGGDRFVVNGDGTVENFVVYARAEAITAGVVVQNAATEIVITRNGVVVGELDNVEEITINTGAGVDTVTAVGDFGPTSLFFNTITVNGGGGRDTIDASQLTSAHRLVLNGSPEEMAQFATIPAFEGLSRAALNSMARAALHDIGMIDFGMNGWRQNVAFANDQELDLLHTLKYHRAPALEIDAVDFGQFSRDEHRALHQVDAADYLII